MTLYSVILSLNESTFQLFPVVIFSFSCASGILGIIVDALGPSQSTSPPSFLKYSLAFILVDCPPNCVLICENEIGLPAPDVKCDVFVTFVAMNIMTFLYLLRRIFNCNRKSMIIPQ